MDLYNKKNILVLYKICTISRLYKIEKNSICECYYIPSFLLVNKEIRGLIEFDDVHREAYEALCKCHISII